jgi:AraC-like DNA-binding protein
MQTPLARSESNAEAWKAVAQLSRREFYEGDLEVDGADAASFALDKAMTYPMSVTHITSRASMSYRRSRQHIRNNNVGFRIIWIVARGALKIVRAQGVCDVAAGYAAVLNTNAPFQVKSICNDEGSFESYQAVVPADLFLTHLQAADTLYDAFSLKTADGEIVQQLLNLIMTHGAHMSRETAKSLAESLLEAVADSAGCRAMERPKRERLTDKRLADIENYILMNVTDPDLTYDKVASCCGISPRYLCYLLRAHGTSFSELLWKNRLPKAREWLVAPATRDYPIHEISFMAGFKSAAHFSRMFKATYGCPPREYRNSHRSDPAPAPGKVELQPSYWRSVPASQAA